MISLPLAPSQGLSKYSIFAGVTEMGWGVHCVMFHAHGGAEGTEMGWSVHRVTFHAHGSAEGTEMGSSVFVSTISRLSGFRIAELQNAL